MPLVLSLAGGQDFYVDEHRFIVTHQFHETQFRLERVADGARFDVVDDRSVEILPGVFCSAGDFRSDRSLARVVLEAPPDVLILRGEKYRQQHPAKPSSERRSR